MKDRLESIAYYPIYAVKVVYGYVTNYIGGFIEGFREGSR